MCSHVHLPHQQKDTCLLQHRNTSQSAIKTLKYITKQQQNHLRVLRSSRFLSDCNGTITISSLQQTNTTQPKHNTLTLLIGSPSSIEESPSSKSHYQYHITKTHINTQKHIPHPHLHPYHHRETHLNFSPSKPQYNNQLHKSTHITHLHGLELITTQIKVLEHNYLAHQY